MKKRVKVKALVHEGEPAIDIRLITDRAAFNTRVFLNTYADAIKLVEIFNILETNYGEERESD